MRNYTEAKKLFEDRIDSKSYFDSMSFEIARKSLTDAIMNTQINLTFLLGESGRGKSFLVNYLIKNFPQDMFFVFIAHPVKSEDDLLTLLFKKMTNEERGSYSLHALRNKVISLYSEKKHTIFIDEAQILNIELLEAIRILSDTKLLKFVLIMHENEGNDILEKPHFKTRQKRIVNLSTLKSNETERYIQQTFIQHSHGEIGSMFTKKHSAAITKLCQGNFRYIKRFVYTVLEILEFAKDEGMERYQNLNNCILTMAAIDGGFLNE